MEIVIDFDGTLALGDTKDISSMRPNLELIILINKMFNDGNKIKIVTARGSKSCNTFAERESKYKDVITQWLNNNKVLYTELSFFKEYGDIYIDDRCCDVNNKMLYERLTSNYTTNNVRRFNEKVYKTTLGTEAVNEFIWYCHAKKLELNIPKIFSYDINTLILSYHQTTKTYTNDINCLINFLNIFKNTPSISNACMHTYIQRIENYILNNNIINKDFFIKKIHTLELPNTFNHGDFSTQNILHTTNGLYLIDPIYNEHLFQSYYIDIAKFLFTVLFFEKDFNFYKESRSKFITTFTIDTSQLDILIACEALRVANRKKQLIDIVNNLIYVI